MGNVGGGEILVILLAALIFLGPEKLPDVARQIGKVMAEVRKVSAGFQREMQDAMKVVTDETKPAPTAALGAAGMVQEPTAPSTVDSTAVDSTPTAGVSVESATTTGTESTPVAPIVASEAPPLPTDLPLFGDR